MSIWIKSHKGTAKIYLLIIISCTYKYNTYTYNVKSPQKSWAIESFSEKNIDLGRYWIGIRRSPVNLKNVLESLNNSWVWSNRIESRDTYIHSFTGRLIATATSYEVNKDPLVYCSFLTLDELSLPSLFNLEPDILFNNYKLTHNSVMVEEGKTKELLLFVWGKEVTSNFSITLAKSTFKINLHTQSNE